MSDYKHGEMDATTQNDTFNGFMSAMKWVALFLLGLLVFLAVFAT